MRTIIAIVFLSLAATARAGDTDVALRYFPARLEQPATGERFQVSVRADFDGRGVADYLVVAYSNGVLGALRVLHLTPEVTLAADSRYREMGGVNPTVELIDFDGDKVPEVMIQFDSANGNNRATWLFRWKSGALSLISPTVEAPHGERDTRLGDIDYFDEDGDGVIEIVNLPRVSRATRDGLPALVGHPEIFKLKDGLYSIGEPLTYFRSFIRGKGEPETEADDFVANPGAYLVEFVRTLDVNERLDSAMVAINSRSAGCPSRFHGDDARCTEVVQLRDANTISVQLDGVPGSALAVAVRPRNGTP